jgi:hypothetical protein
MGKRVMHTFVFRFLFCSTAIKKANSNVNAVIRISRNCMR